MPTIPAAQQRIGAIPLTTYQGGRQALSGALQSRAATHRQTGALYGNLGKQLADTTLQLSQMMQNAGAATEFANAKTQTEKMYQDYLQSLPGQDITDEKVQGYTDPAGETTSYTYSQSNYDQYLEGYEEFQAGTYEQMIGGLKSPKAQKAYAEWYGQHMIKNRANVMKFRIQKEMGDYQHDYAMRVNQYIETRDVDGLIADTDRMVADSVISTDAATKIKTDVVNQIKVAQAVDFMDAIGYENGLQWIDTEDAQEFLPTEGMKAEAVKQITAVHTRRAAAEQAQFERLRPQHFQEALGLVENMQVGAPDSRIDKITDILNEADWKLTGADKTFLFRLYESQEKEILAKEKEAAEAQLARETQAIEIAMIQGQDTVTVRNPASGEPETISVADAIQRHADKYPGDDSVTDLIETKQEDWEKGKRADVEAYMSKVWSRGQLTQELVDMVANHPDAEVRETADTWAGRFRSQEKDGKDRLPPTEPNMDWQARYQIMALDPETSGQEMEAWMERTMFDPQGNLIMAQKTWKRYFDQIGDWKDGPTWVNAYLEGIQAKYKELIRGAGDDADEKSRLTEEMINTVSNLRESAQKEGWSREELARSAEYAETPLNRKIADAEARQKFGRGHILGWFFESPEEQMKKWATEGRLDEYGRLIGASLQTQLEVLGIDSFDQLDWDRNKRYQKLKEKMDDLGVFPENLSRAPQRSTARPNIGLDGQQLYLTGPSGEIRWGVIVAGREEWVTPEEFQRLFDATPGILPEQQPRTAESPNE